MWIHQMRTQEQKQIDKARYLNKKLPETRKV